MTFREWLEIELARQGVSRRELARRIAARHPAVDQLAAGESARRTLKRILNGKTQRPSQATRDSICDALDVPRDVPPQQDPEDEPVTREEIAEFRRLSLRIERSLVGSR